MVRARPTVGGVVITRSVRQALQSAGGVVRTEWPWDSGGPGGRRGGAPAVWRSNPAAPARIGPGAVAPALRHADRPHGTFPSLDVSTAAIGGSRRGDRARSGGPRRWMGTDRMAGPCMTIREPWHREPQSSDHTPRHPGLGGRIVSRSRQPGSRQRSEWFRRTLEITADSEAIATIRDPAISATGRLGPRTSCHLHDSDRCRLLRLLPDSQDVKYGCGNDSINHSLGFSWRIGPRFAIRTPVGAGRRSMRIR